MKGSNRVHEPSAIGVRKLYPSNLLPSINDQAVRNAFPELFFDECTIGQVLDHVIGIHLASGRWPIRFLEFDRHNPLSSSDEAVWLS